MPTLKKLCDNDPTNWDKYLNQVLANYRVTLNLATVETPFFNLWLRSKPTTSTSRTNAQKTMDREPPSFKLGNRVYFKNKQPGKWGLKQRPRYKIVPIEHDGHCLHMKNQAMGKTWSCNVKNIVLEPPIEFKNIDMKFGRVRKYINHPANLLTIILNN